MTRGTKILVLAWRVTVAGLISLLVLALCFELYLRRAGFLKAQPANYPCIAGDLILNHVFQPNCEAKARGEDLKTAKDVTYKTNHLAYRWHAPDPGKNAIVVIGDSYTEGFGLEEEESFPAVLESSLRAAGNQSWQVLNGGTMGYSTALYAAYFDRFFLQARPRFVLLNLDISDFNDDPYYLVNAEYDSRNTPIAFPGREILPSFLMPLVYSNSSAVLRFAHQEMNQWSSVKRRDNSEHRLDEWIESKEPLIASSDLKATHLEGCAKPIELVAKHILLLKARSDLIGSDFAIHMYPPGQFIKSYPEQPQNISFVQKWDQAHRKNFSWACGVGPSVVTVMKRFADRQKIPFFDSFPFVNARPDKAELYFDRDAHWNARGVRLVVGNLVKQMLPLFEKSGKKGK